MLLDSAIVNFNIYFYSTLTSICLSILLGAATKLYGDKLISNWTKGVATSYTYRVVDIIQLLVCHATPSKNDHKRKSKWHIEILTVISLIICSLLPHVIMSPYTALMQQTVFSKATNYTSSHVGKLLLASMPWPINWNGTANNGPGTNYMFISCNASTAKVLTSYENGFLVTDLGVQVLIDAFVGSNSNMTFTLNESYAYDTLYNFYSGTVQCIGRSNPEASYDWMPSYWNMSDVIYKCDDVAKKIGPLRLQYMSIPTANCNSGQDFKIAYSGNAFSYGYSTALDENTLNVFQTILGRMGESGYDITHRYISIPFYFAISVCLTGMLVGPLLMYVYAIFQGYQTRYSEVILSISPSYERDLLVNMSSGEGRCSYLPSSSSATFKYVITKTSEKTGHIHPSEIHQDDRQNETWSYELLELELLGQETQSDQCCDRCGSTIKVKLMIDHDVNSYRESRHDIYDYLEELGYDILHMSICWTCISTILQRGEFITNNASDDNTNTITADVPTIDRNIIEYNNNNNSKRAYNHRITASTLANRPLVTRLGLNSIEPTIPQLHDNTRNNIFVEYSNKDDNSNQLPGGTAEVQLVTLQQAIESNNMFSSRQVASLIQFTSDNIDQLENLFSVNDLTRISHESLYKNFVDGIIEDSVECDTRNDGHFIVTEAVGNCVEDNLGCSERHQ